MDCMQQSPGVQATADTLPREDRELMRRYYQTLYDPADGHAGAAVVYVANGKGKPQDVRFIRPGDIDRLVDETADLTQKGNTYCLVDLIAPDAVDGIRHRHGRGNEKELCAMVAFRADIDAEKPGSEEKGHNYPPRARILDALGKMPLPTTMIVGSGSAGVHAYWCLHEPEPTGDERKRGWLKALSREWQQVLRSKLGRDENGNPYDLDSTADLARVLRPAGSIHHGRKTIVEIIECDPTRRYEVADFEEYLVVQRPEEKRDDADAEPIDATPLGLERGTIVEQARWWLSQFPPVALGQGYDKGTFHAACALTIGYVLSVDEALPLLAEWNKGCNPPWSDADLLHKLNDASKKPGRRGYLIAAPPHRSLSNVRIEKDADGKAVVVPLPITNVIEDILKATDNWPRRVGASLFVDEGEIQYLPRAASLFGWLSRKTGATIRWCSCVGAVTKEETYAELQRTATEYRAVENMPHCPSIAGHYYAVETPEPGDGSALEKFLDFFCVETPLDRQMLCAAVATPLSGIPPGTRPAFLITCLLGRGRGKSTLAQRIGQLYGGLIDVSAKEEIGVIKQRLLTPEAATRRVALLDNVKTTRFSWSELESLITIDTINGKRLYVGDASRPNYLTWIITLNGASLSTDMAQRVVEIRLAEPKFDGGWEERTREFIERHRFEIIADLVAFLQREPKPLKRLSRWATWETQVLARVDDPNGCLDLIVNRRDDADVEHEEGEIIEDYFAMKLRGLGYDVDRADVFIPNATAARWFNAATGDNRKTAGVARTLKQLRDERTIWRLKPARAGVDGERGFRWIGEAADSLEPVAQDLRERVARQLDGTKRDNGDYSDDREW